MEFRSQESGVQESGVQEFRSLGEIKKEITPLPITN
jgi:hypothetical protein